MAKQGENQILFNLAAPAGPQGPVECLGKRFDSDEARREYFLGVLREGLEERHAKLGGVPFPTGEDAIQRFESLEHWPVGGEGRVRELAERMGQASRVQRLASSEPHARRTTRDLETQS